MWRSSCISNCFSMMVCSSIEFIDTRWVLRSSHHSFRSFQLFFCSSMRMKKQSLPTTTHFVPWWPPPKEHPEKRILCRLLIWIEMMIFWNTLLHFVLRYFTVVLRGQSYNLHSSFSVASPSQGFPPYASLTSTLRVFIFLEFFPQVLSHFPLFQGPHLQWTIILIFYVLSLKVKTRYNLS